MKKSLLAMLLAVALVLPAVPAFADSDDGTDLELIPKVGYLFTPELKAKDGAMKYDSTFSVGADLFFDLENNFFAGVGLVWGNNHKLAEGNDNKLGFTNVYAALKYKVLVNGNENAPVYFYPLVNLGVGIPSWDVTVFGASDFEMLPGFYWGVGAGLEICNIIIEGIYGCDYSTQKFKRSDGTNFEENFSYTAFRLNVGYKFSL